MSSNKVVVVSDSRIPKLSFSKDLFGDSANDQEAFTYSMKTRYYCADLTIQLVDLAEIVKADTSAEDTDATDVVSHLKSASSVIYLYDHSPQGFAVIHEAFEKHEIDKLHADAETCLLIGTSSSLPSEDDRLWLHARSLAVDHCCELVHCVLSHSLTYDPAEPSFDPMAPTDAEGGADELEVAGLRRVWDALSCCPWPDTAAGAPEARPPVFEGAATEPEARAASSEATHDVQGGVGAADEHAAADADIRDLADLAALALNAPAVRSTADAAQDADERAFESMEQLMSRAGAVRARALAGEGSVASRRKDAEAVALALAKAMGLFGGDDEDDMDLSDLLGGE